MDTSVCNLSWPNLMKDGTDFNDQSSVIFGLWNKYHKSKNEYDQINELCHSFIQIKQKLDPEQAHASLTACFDKNFWNSFGIQMLFYSLHSLFQSYRAWNLINSFHIPSYENQIRRAKEKLDECVTMCSSLIDLPILNQEQMRKLQCVQELLRDIKDAIQFIVDDVKNKIVQVEKYRSNNYLSALMNFFSSILNAMLWDKISKASGEYSRSSLTTGASTLIQATCTVGDLIHAGKANDFIYRLQEILSIMTDLEDKQQRLSIQVTYKLSNINIEI